MKVLSDQRRQQLLFTPCLPLRSSCLSTASSSRRELLSTRTLVPTTVPLLQKRSTYKHGKRRIPHRASVDGAAETETASESTATTKTNSSSSTGATQPPGGPVEGRRPSLVNRADFPILSQMVNDKPLVYLDSAATSQKPRVVIDALTQFYETTNANVHRGAHTLAARATSQYERTREKIVSLIGASNPDEVIYTRNATEGINVIATAWGRQHVKEGDVIFVSEMEHHANLVPWQVLAQDVGAQLDFIPLLPDCAGYDVEAFRARLQQRVKNGDVVKVVALNHVSNVLGCVNPVDLMAAEVRRICSGGGGNENGNLNESGGVCIVCDACQSVPHMAVDVNQLGADFVVASAHKMLGPTGIGFIWARYDTLKVMRPFLYGGEMIQDVFLDRSTFTTPPHRFEAGTPSIAETVAFASAIDYLTDDTGGMDAIHDYEQYLATYLWNRLTEFKEVHVYGPPPPHRAALCAFNVDGVHSGDLATLLDTDGVAVRSGHHCAQPLHRKLNVQSSARASLYVYNTTEEIDILVDAMRESVTLLGGSMTLKTL